MNLPVRAPRLLRKARETVAANTPAAPVALAPAPAPESAEPTNVEPQRLFRTEALEAQRAQWLGPVLLLPRPSHAVFTAFAVLAVAAIAALLFFGEYTRKARVPGWLVPQHGLVHVYAPQVGVVSELKVREGATVQRGEPLAVLSAERQSAQLGATEAEIARLLAARRRSLEEELVQQQQLLAQQRAGVERRLRAIREEIAQFDSEIAVQTSRRELAKASADRMRELAKQGFASKMQLQQQEENDLDQRARLRTLERTRAERMRELTALRAEYDEMPLKARSIAAATERSIRELEQESAAAEARRTLVVPAPQSGTVTAVQAHVGAAANLASPLLSIVPAGSRLEAHLYAPSRSVGFIQPGQTVLLRYQAYPYQKFGHHTGRVVSVSSSAMSPNDLPVQQAGLTSLAGAGEPLYRIVVALEQQAITAYGEQRALQPGMQLESDILLERRRLYEWLLEPLYTLTGSL